MYRACELKDQTYKKTRTLQFSEKLQRQEIREGKGIFKELWN